MKRGEIYIVELGPSVGNERGGVRPVVIVSNDVINPHPYTVTAVVGEDAANVPVTSGIAVTAVESGAPFDIVFLIHQLRSLDPARFTTGPVGTVPVELMPKIDFALQVHLELRKVPLPPRP